MRHFAIREKTAFIIFLSSAIAILFLKPEILAARERAGHERKQL
jgi:hypothetical protein